MRFSCTMITTWLKVGRVWAWVKVGARETNNSKMLAMNLMSNLPPCNSGRGDWILEFGKTTGPVTEIVGSLADLEVRQLRNPFCLRNPNNAGFPLQRSSSADPDGGTNGAYLGCQGIRAGMSRNEGSAYAVPPPLLWLACLGAVGCLYFLGLRPLMELLFSNHCL